MKNITNSNIKSRWYLSTLIVILTVVGGLVSKKQGVVPNQEIVFQFENKTHTGEQASQAVALVKSQLERIGVENLKVIEEVGQIKLTYYSDTDVESIKTKLSENQALVLKLKSSKKHRLPINYPSEDDEVACNLDVNELHSNHDISFDKRGKVAVVIKAGKDHYFNSCDYVLNTVFHLEAVETQIHTAYKFHKRIALTLDNTSNSIPEVRAGPQV
ncbi:hypothetical protein [Formosa sp. S-31]|uniref:hypothetical protein n=1 Tax=Formosa sp. S-31 TaxID=2790949 RepID=UPI003EC07BD6